MTTPTLSVTITNYNYAHYIGRALDSILAQTFDNFEVVIVDNASTDNSVEVIEEYIQRDPRIRLIKHVKNMGHHFSMREAADEARGRYRVQVDADDWVLGRDTFARQVAALESEPEAAFVFSSVAGYNNRGHRVVALSAFDSDTTVTGVEGALRILSTFAIAHTGVMMRMSSYHATGGYDTRFVHPIDLKLWMDLCAQGKVVFIHDPLYGCRIHDVSISRTTNLQLVRDETLQVIETVFNGPLGKQMANPAKERRRVIQHALNAELTNSIFSGRYREGWTTYLSNVRLMPIETLFQRQTLILAMRTILGAKGFQVLERVLRP